MPAHDPAAPRWAGPRVRRPRLLEKLESGTRQRVTVVSGPAGSGKTLLVDAWLREGAWKRPSAWVSVDPGTRFWPAVAGALHSCGVLVRAPRAAHAHDRLVERLAEGLRQRAAPALLVIDGIDRLPAKAAADGVAALLTPALADLRLLLITRRRLQLGLHRLRVAGDVTEVRAEDLAFTADEADELLTAAGVHLAAESLARLHTRTEGWAAGLHLAVLSLAGRPDPDRLADRFSGAESTVAEYLTGEILAGLPPAVRRMLRRTSGLERVSGPLANLLAGRSDGDRVLQDLEAANAFVTSIDPARIWFRYHPLLADLLRMELRRDPPDEIRRLDRAAARWHATYGTPFEAIRHAQAARDWRMAADLLLRSWLGLLLDGRQYAIGKLLDAFPAQLKSDDPGLVAIAAADRFATGSPEVAAAGLVRAERLAQSVRDTRRPAFEMTLAVAGLARARRRGDAQTMIDTARLLLAAAEDDDLRAFSLMTMGFAEFWALTLDDAERHLQESLELARRIRRPYLAVGCLGPLAHIANLNEQAAVAEERSREAIELADRLGWSEDPIVGHAYLALGGGMLSRGRFEQAETWLDRASRALAGVRDPEASVSLPFTRGILRFGQRRYDEAVAWLREAERAPAAHFLSASATTWRLRAQVHLGDTGAARRELSAVGEAARSVAEWCNLQAYVDLAEHDPQAAAEALRPVLDGSAAAFHVNLEIEALLLSAAALDGLGEADAAELAVERALALADPKEHVWIVLTVAGVASLLERHPRHRTAHGAFLSELLDRLASIGAARPSIGFVRLTSALSARELEVLGFLPTNLTAVEIATELVLSVHTVKTHMRTLYSKLGVHRRADAVARARALGILAPARRGRR